MKKIKLNSLKKGIVLQEKQEVTAKQVRKCETPCKKQEHCLRANAPGELFSPEKDANGECLYYWKL